MKIFLVLHGFPPECTGGTERAVATMAKDLSAAGHQVTVVCGSLEVGSTDRVDKAEHEGIRVLRLHRDDLYFEDWYKSYHPGVSRTLDRLFRSERPDVVHVHHWLRLTSDIARLARDAGARVVVSAHDHFPVLARVTSRVGEDPVRCPAVPAWMSRVEAEEHFALHRRDFAAELRAAHLRTAPSRAHGSRLAELTAEPLGDFQVSAPPLLEVPPRLGEAPTPGGNRLVTWGSLYPEKGLEVLLDGLRRVAGDWRLTVMGEAHEVEYREDLARRADGLAVTFVGGYRMEDLAAVAADYAVLPSLCHESYGLVMDEAQALGLPVIASDLPAFREHCQPESCLFLTPGDPSAWAAALADRSALATLRRPDPPALASPEARLATWSSWYEASPSDLEPGLDPCAEAALARDRARLLFRRGERRLFAILEAGVQVRPPDDFLA